MDFLHIYGQEMWHSPVHIAGTRSELIKLAQTINQALYCPRELDTITLDRESYFVRVMAFDNDHTEYENKPIPLPYTDPVALPRQLISIYDIWKSICKYWGVGGRKK